MWSFERFLTSISQLFGDSDVLKGRATKLAELNPDKIYVENVRGLIGVSHREALRICETAVRQGTFRRFVEVLCPDDVVAASAPTEAELPLVVHCWLDHNGEYEDIELATSGLRKLTFYRLVDDESPDLHPQTA